MRKFLILPPLVLASVASVASVASSAWADVPRDHDLVLTGDFSFSYQHFSESGDSDNTVDIFRVSPSLDYVATHGITVGVGLFYAHTAITDNDSANDFGIVPRVGYIGELGPNVFLWPRLGLGYLRGFGDLVGIATSTGSISVNRVQFQAELFLCYSPVPHFFLGAGPVFHTDLSSSISSDSPTVSSDASKLTSIGVGSMVGGYF